MAMSVALTRSSDQLKEAFEQDPAAFIDLVGCGIAARDHFENVLDLLSGAVARLGAVTYGYSGSKQSEEILRKAREIIQSKLALADYDFDRD